MASALTMRYWLPLVSWYSSTSTWSNRPASSRRIAGMLGEQLLGAQQQVVEIDHAAGLELRSGSGDSAAAARCSRSLAAIVRGAGWAGSSGSSSG